MVNLLFQGFPGGGPVLDHCDQSAPPPLNDHLIMGETKVNIGDGAHIRLPKRVTAITKPAENLG
jgi:hypothetical protein